MSKYDYKDKLGSVEVLFDGITVTHLVYNIQTKHFEVMWEGRTYTLSETREASKEDFERLTK